MTDDEFAAAVEAVRDRVDPDEEERARLATVTDEVLTRTREAVVDLSVDADVMVVGSTARDTWVSGDRDVDVFVRFPTDIDREELEEYGLTVGNTVLPDGHEEFAEHPYVSGPYDGFDVDIVPCYDVETAADIRSAVDRTPFHTRWLTDHLDGLADDARLSKAFLKGIGVYGSNLRTEGFSGYLTELLVVEFGGFRPLVEAAADWHPPLRFDPGDTESDAAFDDPLIVVDPTDPDRNVAAVCSASNLARFQHHARRMLDDPSPGRFFPDPPTPLWPDAVREHVRRRNTTPVALRFPAPDVVDDQLYPQLRRTRSGVIDELDRRGFRTLRSATYANDTAVILLELAVADLPNVERHEGPPVHVRDHAERFYEQYADTDAYGPFVEDGRYVVERDRDCSSATAFLESDALFNVGVGPDIESALREGYEVLVEEDVAELAEEFSAELAAYFDPTP
jgi:tRNA nucleotidyltransferase (CCA-adding enzyme)